MHGDKIFALVRTDPGSERHRGISMLLIDMHQPGVDARPLKQMSGASEFGEVFFTDARVPATEVLGDIGDGWRTAMLLLSFERGASGIGQYTEFRRQYDAIVGLARSARPPHRPGAARPARPRAHRPGVPAAALDARAHPGGAGPRPGVRGVDDEADVVGDVPGPLGGLRRPARRGGHPRSRVRGRRPATAARAVPVVAVGHDLGRLAARSSATSSPSACSACRGRGRDVLRTHRRPAEFAAAVRGYLADRFDLAAVRGVVEDRRPATATRPRCGRPWASRAGSPSSSPRSSTGSASAWSRPRSSRGRSARAWPRAVARHRARRRGDPAGRVRRAAGDVAAPARRRATAVGALARRRARLAAVEYGAIADVVVTAGRPGWSRARPSTPRGSLRRHRAAGRPQPAARVEELPPRRAEIAVDRAAVLVAADLVGIAREALTRTVAYDASAGSSASRSARSRRSSTPGRPALAVTMAEHAALYAAHAVDIGADGRPAGRLRRQGQGGRRGRGEHRAR